MKYIFTLLITIYQFTLSPILFSIFGQQCRYSPSCSAYAKQAILEKGVIIGIYLAVKRLLSCQPFFTKT
ncbi:MAG: membrane protein insertion efficiency factor YidD [Candidatus Levybacteria bacterium]|nr:membrane protein insertion efficiency factor YidD [Candidatus Levybacteria bacterium]